LTDHVGDFREFVLNQPAEKHGDGTRYSGSPRVHHGLSNPTMRGFVKQWAREHPDLDFDGWRSLLTGLYEGDSIEERMLAGFMLGRYTRFRRELSLPTLDGWIAHLEGWREIDTTCQSNFSAAEVLSNWQEWQPFLVDLSTRELVQSRRASLVLLVRPVRGSGDVRLLETALGNVDRLRHETDKLVTKAISWVLREVMKNHRQAVGDYVSKRADVLPAIAVREFNKKYKTGRR